MVDYTNNNDNAINEVMNDLDLKTSATYDNTIDETQQQQINTTEMLIEEERRRREEEEERDYQTSPDYDDEPIEEEAEYYVKDENENGIPDNEEIGTYNEDENITDEFRERSQQSDIYGISEEAQEEARLQNKSSKKSDFKVDNSNSFNDKFNSAGNKISQKAKDFAQATAGFIGGFSVAKSTSKSGKGITISHKSKGKKAKSISMGVKTPQSKTILFPRAPSAPTPYGNQRRSKAQLTSQRHEEIGYNQNFDPIGLNNMNKSNDNNPFFGSNYRVTTFNLGLPQTKTPVKSQSKSNVKRVNPVKEATAQSIFGIGSSNLTGDLFGFTFKEEKPKKKSKKSKKITEKSQVKQQSNEFESLFGFKL